MIHNLLLELVVLPNVLALALHQVNYFGWMDQGDHSWYRTKLLLEVSVPCDFSVSPRSKSFFFLFLQLLFDLGACWDQDLDQGLTIVRDKE